MSTPGQSNPVGDTTQVPSVAQFLIDFPEFNTALNIDGQQLEINPNAVQYWLNIAQLLLNPIRWGRMYYFAVEWFVAHNLALDAWATQGGPLTVPGLAKGAIAAKAAGDVSVNYDSAATLASDAGHWNYTVYGQRLIRYIRMAGAGPVYVGVGFAPAGSQTWFSFANSSAAFSGPPVYNFPNPDCSG